MYNLHEQFLRTTRASAREMQLRTVQTRHLTVNLETWEFLDMEII